MLERRLFRRQRTVAWRVLLSFAIALAGFALVAWWSAVALRDAAGDARLMRAGYLPLGLALRDLVAAQDNWNAQLNHITTARNPADKRIWFDSALRVGRPKKYAEVRAAISNAFIGIGQASVAEVGRELMAESLVIERFVEGDRERLNKLFDALDRGDGPKAERLRDELVTRGLQTKKRLSALEQRVQGHIDELLDTAGIRERLAMRLLFLLSGFTALIGIGMALNARRVLLPLGAVTERAKAVAGGDLTPRDVVPSNDEIGELAVTFERMVSAIARANEQLLATERLATIGKMAAHVTHEIRNPLSSIALNIELLEDDLVADPDEARSLLRAIKQEVERLSALSDQYLSVARRKPSALDEEDLGELVEEACAFVRPELRRHGIELQITVDPDLPKVLGDEAQIKQALFNLLRNAREAMAEGGTIGVEVRAAAGGGVDVTVDDEGVGIEPEIREKLFEPFFSTKGTGTGLGLAITRQIVETHGGTIACEPRRPRGTRFWLHLPERQQAAETLSCPSGEPPASGG